MLLCAFFSIIVPAIFQTIEKISDFAVHSAFELAIICMMIVEEVLVKGNRYSRRTSLALIIGFFNEILNDYSSLFRSVSSVPPSLSI